jgi:hypothetical protein
MPRSLASIETGEAAGAGTAKQRVEAIAVVVEAALDRDRLDREPTRGAQRPAERQALVHARILASLDRALATDGMPPIHRLRSPGGRHG